MKVKLFRLLCVVTHGEALHSFWVSKSRLQNEMQRLVRWHLLPLSNKNLLAQWLVKLRREITLVNKSSYVCSQYFEPNCFIKPMGGQRIRLMPDSVPTKFIFTVEKPRRKKPADRASLNTKKTNTEKSQPARIQSPNLSILKTVLYTLIRNRVQMV